MERAWSRRALGMIDGVRVVVHDRTGELPARVREYAEKRLLRVGRHFDRVVEAAADVGKEWHIPMRDDKSVDDAIARAATRLEAEYVLPPISNVRVTLLPVETGFCKFPATWPLARTTAPFAITL